MRKGDNEHAIQDSNQAIQLDPKNANAYGDRGDAYMTSGDYDYAIQDYDQLIQLNPVNIAAHGNRGRSLFFIKATSGRPRRLVAGNELEINAYATAWQYLARRHAGEDGAANLGTNAVRLKSTDWPYPVIEMFLGKRSPADVQSVAATPEERCEAQFYIGEWYLLRANGVAAGTALRNAASICRKDFDEYAGAVAELKRLNVR